MSPTESVAADDVRSGAGQLLAAQNPSRAAFSSRSQPARGVESPAVVPSVGLPSVADMELAVAVPSQLVEAVARRAAELLAEWSAGPEPWIGVPAAAEHIAAPVSRIYALASAGRIPHVKDGSRLLFRRSTLDAWLDAGGGVRP